MFTHEDTDPSVVGKEDTEVGVEDDDGFNLEDDEEGIGGNDDKGDRVGEGDKGEKSQRGEKRSSRVRRGSDMMLWLASDVDVDSSANIVS